MSSDGNLRLGGQALQSLTMVTLRSLLTQHSQSTLFSPHANPRRACLDPQTVIAPGLWSQSDPGSVLLTQWTGKQWVEETSPSPPHTAQLLPAGAKGSTKVPFGGDPGNCGTLEEARLR